MKSNKNILFALVGFALCTGTTHAATIIFSEDFESTGLADGAFQANWDGPNGTVFSVGNGGTILNPAGTGGTSGWLNPVPAALGDIFVTLGNGQTATGDTAQTFTAGLEYTLTFTNFRRDDINGDSIRASIGNSAGALASVDFDAVTTTDTFVTRTISYTATGSDAGQNIFLRFTDFSGTGSSPQAGVDNIELTVVPEPSSFALLAGCFGLAWVMVRRRG